MRIGGLHKHSLIDYPGRISAVVFTQGCNFRCPYCHNPSLVYPEQYGALIDPEEVLRFLSKRQGLIDAVVITGGEPLLQQDLEVFLQKVRDMGFKVKLDTNGSRPDRLKSLLSAGLIDYVAMDYKAPLRAYSHVAGVDVKIEKIQESITYIISSGVEYEIKSTIYSRLGMNSIIDMISELKSLGVEVYYLQIFKSRDNNDEFLRATDIDIQYLQEYLLCHFWRWGIRNYGDALSETSVV